MWICTMFMHQACMSWEFLHTEVFVQCTLFRLRWWTVWGMGWAMASAMRLDT